MPVKWKIFLAFNFILALPAVTCFILLLINFINSRYRDSEDYLFTFLFLFGFSMITLNCFLNIYVLQRFFPDKLIPLATRRMHLITLVLTSLVAIGLLILCIYGASIEFSSDNEYRDTTGRIALVILFVALILQMTVLIMQAQLPGLISRNNQNRMHSLIDSIGESH